MTAVWLGNPLTVSNSEIQTYKACRRKWYLTYYLELGSPERIGNVGPRELGTRIHVALHAMYETGENPITVIDELYASGVDELKYFDQNVNEMVPDDEAIIKLRKEQDLAHAMLEGFLDWVQEEGIDDGLELTAAETVIETKSGVEGVIIRGKLDQRVVRKIDGARLFRDWKTAADFNGIRLLPMDEQMKFYHLLEYMDSLEKTGREPQWRTDGGLYTVLRKVKRTAAAKPPFYMNTEIKHNSHELVSMWKRVHKILEEIVLTRQALDNGSEHDYMCPPRPSRDCSWSCDFVAVCPLMDDGSDYKRMLGDHYVHIDPHDRYKAEDEGKGK